MDARRLDLFVRPKVSKSWFHVPTIVGAVVILWRTGGTSLFKIKSILRRSGKEEERRKRRKKRKMEHEIALLVDGLVSPPSVSQCRICHEEEGEDGSSSKSLETPCACSGTLKFAHRECIQRWCEEKGNTTCEICLQKFEPGYTIPKKARLADVAVTIRESLEVPRQGNEMQNTRLLALVAAEGEALGPDYAECSSVSDRSASCCRSVTLIFAILLLVRHLASVLSGGTDRYAFAVFTLLVLRAGGVILPLYIIMRTIEAIRQKQRQQQHYHASASSLEEAEEDDDEDDDDSDEQMEHAIQIHQ